MWVTIFLWEEGSVNLSKLEVSIPMSYEALHRAHLTHLSKLLKPYSFLSFEKVGKPSLSPSYFMDILRINELKYLL